MKRVARQAIFASFTAAAIAAVTTGAQASENFVLFESGQVRPLALSPSGSKLFAVNTPDNRLEVFHVLPGRLVHTDSVPVGLEPVAVAARSEHEVWVVNHLSDSISIVDVGSKSRVTRTLLVGDEPRDIVFAGPGRNRAFVTVAHLGQNIPFDPQLTTPGVGRADVWVFNANNLGGDAQRRSDQHHQPVHRHAARADRDARRQEGLRGRHEQRQSHDHRQRVSPAPVRPAQILQPPPHTNFQGIPSHQDRFHGEVRRSALAR